MLHCVDEGAKEQGRTPNSFLLRRAKFRAPRRHQRRSRPRFFLIFLICAALPIRELANLLRSILPCLLRCRPSAERIYTSSPTPKPTRAHSPPSPALIPTYHHRRSSYTPITCTILKGNTPRTCPPNPSLRRTPPHLHLRRTIPPSRWPLSQSMSPLPSTRSQNHGHRMCPPKPEVVSHHRSRRKRIV